MRSARKRGSPRIDDIIKRFRVACGETGNKDRHAQLYAAALAEFDTLDPGVSHYFAVRWLAATGYAPKT